MRFPLSTFLRKFRRNREDYGLRVAIGKSAAYLVKPVYESRVYRIYKLEVNGMAPAATPVASGRFVLRLLDPGEETLIRRIEEHSEWLRGRVKPALREGAICLIGMDGDTLAGFNLVEFWEMHIPLVRMRRPLKPGEAWSSQITVFKPYRRLGLASEMRFRVFEELERRNIRKIYGATLRSNEPALGLSRKVGFRELVDVRYRKVLGHDMWRYDRIGKQAPDKRDSAAVYGDIQEKSGKGMG